METLREDQREILIKKLTALLSEIMTSEIDKVVDFINTLLLSGAKETKHRERLETFNDQVQTLIDKGYPEATGMVRDHFLEYVNPLGNQFEIGDIIVIPERIVSVPKQMSMVQLNGKTGYTYLNLGMLRQADGVETSNVPYLIRDVENGAATRKTSPNNCVKQFKDQGRFGLVTEEGIAIITHKPEMLNDHQIALPGSRYGSDSVPVLWLDGGRPKLSYYWAESTSSKLGSASCGSRIRA